MGYVSRDMKMKIYELSHSGDCKNYSRVELALRKNVGL